MNELNQLGEFILQELAEKHRSKHFIHETQTNKAGLNSIGYFIYKNIKFYIVLFMVHNHEHRNAININVQYEMRSREFSGYIVAYFINTHEIKCGVDGYIIPHYGIIKSASLADPESLQIIVDVFDDVITKAKITL